MEKDRRFPRFPLPFFPSDCGASVKVVVAPKVVDMSSGLVLPFRSGSEMMASWYFWGDFRRAPGSGLDFCCLLSGTVGFSLLKLGRLRGEFGRVSAMNHPPPNLTNLFIGFFLHMPLGASYWELLLLLLWFAKVS